MAIDMKAIHDSQRTLVMGVLNITEDSFSDGGLWLAPEAAKAHGEAMMKAGADIIGVAGLPAPRAMCRTPTPPATSMAW